MVYGIIARCVFFVGWGHLIRLDQSKIRVSCQKVSKDFCMRRFHDKCESSLLLTCIKIDCKLKLLSFVDSECLPDAFVMKHCHSAKYANLELNFGNLDG